MPAAFQANAFQTVNPSGNNAFQLKVASIGSGGQKKKQDFVVRSILGDNEFVEISKIFLQVLERERKWL